MPPAARADLIIDFAGFEGRTFTLLNSANAPYPSGDAPDPETNGQVMQFRVNLRFKASTPRSIPLVLARGCEEAGISHPPLSGWLVPELGIIAPGVTISKRRQLILNEVEGDGGPMEVAPEQH